MRGLFLEITPYSDMMSAPRFVTCEKVIFPLCHIMHHAEDGIGETDEMEIMEIM